MEGDVVVLQDLFIFDKHGVDADGRVKGEHKATGLRPQFITRLAQQGITMPTEVFRAGEHWRAK
jgi:pilus assembly protein CpaF